MYDFKANTYTPLTDYVGKNAYPMWIGNRLYFVSDRGKSGIANLFTYDFATKKVDQVTDFADFDVQMPETDGSSIVFVQAGWLHVLDTATNRVRRVNVEMPGDRWKLADRTINPRDFIHSMTVSNDGKTAVFEARGDIYAVAADDSSVPRNLTRTPGTRERFPQLSPDGARVAFYSDKSGDYQIYVTDAAGGRPWEQLTTALDRYAYHLEWSPDGSKILFGNKDFTIFVLDVATKQLTKVASSNQMKNDEFFWEVSDYSWSPDGKWIAYSFVEFNRNNKVFLYSLDQAKSYPLTDGFYDSLNPSFDANGEYLYFLSYRDFTARMDVFEDNHVILNPVQVMAVQLKAGQAPPFEKAPARKADAQPFRIDLAGIERRVFPLPVKSGNYFFLKAGKGARHVGVHRLLRRERIRDHLHAVGRGQVDAERVRHGREEAVRVRGPHQRLAAFAEPGAGDRQERQRLLHRPRREGGRAEGLRDEAQPRPDDLSREPRWPSGRRSSTTAGAGTATSSTTPTCTAATGRPSATSSGPCCRS